MPTPCAALATAICFSWRRTNFSSNKAPKPSEPFSSCIEQAFKVRHGQRLRYANIRSLAGGDGKRGQRQILTFAAATQFFRLPQTMSQERDTKTPSLRPCSPPCCH